MHRIHGVLLIIILLVVSVSYLLTKDKAPIQLQPSEKKSRSAISEDVLETAADKTITNDVDLDKMHAKYRQYRSLFETREDFQHFFENAELMDADAKQEKLTLLQAKVESLRQQQQLSEAESLMMKLALLKFMPDSEEAKAIGRSLVEDYQALSASRMKAFVDNPDPKFKDYKRKEAAIVQEVLNMSVYPDGLTRDEYLAKRLAQARRESYSTEANKND